VTASVQLVGVFLVFASLIIPALTARGVATKRPLIFAYGIGLAGYALGLFASAFLDLPTGAAVVCSLALVGSVTGLIRGIMVPRPSTR
jgi:zinc/manganese transport system permease protein